VTVSVSKPAPITAQGAPLLSARKQLDVITAYRQVGTYRGAAEMCGLTHKTVKRIIDRDQAAVERVASRRNYESVRSLVAAKVEQTKGKISAKRLLPEARGAGYEASDRNFRRLVAQEKGKHRQRQAIAGSRRPAVWSPGEHVVIDWGVLNGLHVFCAVLAWSRVRFVRFAEDERAETTMRLLAECFSELGGVPRVVLADRMGCLKGGVVADVSAEVQAAEATGLGMAPRERVEDGGLAGAGQPHDRDLHDASVTLARIDDVEQRLSGRGA